MRKGLLAVLVAILVSACGTNPVNGLIIVGSLRDNLLLIPGVYAVNTDAQEIQVDIPFTDVTKAQWSPDNLWIAYSTEQSEPGQLFLVSIDGRQRYQLTSDRHADGSEPSWSPDGNQLAASYGGTIFLTNVSCIRRSSVCTFDYRPILDGFSASWSPDGKQLAIGTPEHQIAIVSVTNSRDKRVISPISDRCDNPAWSPKGNRIAFSCSVMRGFPNNLSDVFLINPDGTGLINLTNNAQFDLAPVWSPDGSQIAFMSDRDPALGKALGGYDLSSNAVYLMNSDGTNVRRITPYNNERVLWLSWTRP